MNTMPFGNGPVTLEDLAIYAKGHGKAPPGLRFVDSASYQRWLDIQRRITTRLSTGDFARYLECVELSKKGETAVSKAMEELTHKILNCSKEEQAKIASHKETLILPPNTRVMVNTKHGKAKGSVAFPIAGGTEYLVTLDEDKAMSPHYHDVNQFKCEEVMPLCSECDEIGSQRCSKCKVKYYCGRECQKLGWPKHKKTCGKKDDTAYCLL